MRRIATIAATSLLACAAIAGGNWVKEVRKSINLGDATSNTNTFQVRGYVYDVEVIPPAASTGIVEVSVQSQADTDFASVNLATGTVVNATSKRWLPRFDGTDIVGDALTGDPPGMYAAAGDTVSVVVSGADPTGTTYKVRFKYITGR